MNGRPSSEKLDTVPERDASPSPAATHPVADRPHMPGYGIQAADEGPGLLPWAWAEERLRGSHDYFVATVRPDGHPHLTPVWGIWHDGAWWFSSAPSSRKARNLRDDPRCSVTTDDAHRPVVLEGRARVVDDPDELAAFVAASNAKYDTDYSVSFYEANRTFRVTPHWAFALDDDDFAGTPTRWVFERDDR